MSTFAAELLHAAAYNKLVAMTPSADAVIAHSSNPEILGSVTSVDAIS
jgi:hypothetical protein